MDKTMFSIDELDIEVLDGDRGKNYPHQDELYEKGHCLFLSATNVTNSGFRFESTVFITKDKDEMLRGGKLRRNDIVITTRGTVGNVAYYNEAIPFEDIRINSGMLIVRCGQSISSEYVYYVFRSPEFQKQIKSIQTGSAQPQLPKSHFLKMRICVPKIETQNRITKILSTLDSKVECNQRINDNLYAQASALYGKYFPYAVTDDLPFGWRVGTVGEIVDIHDSKRIPLSGAQRSKMEKRIYPYYGAASLMDYVDEYIFDGKYLLLGEDGTVVDDAGYPILQYVWGQFWVNNHAHILTGKLGFNVESLLLLFKRTPVKSIVTGAVQPKISQANLRSIQVVIPPQTDLDAFNELICPLFDQIRQNQDQNKALASMRDALLPKLMSGEIDVSSIDI